MSATDTPDSIAAQAAHWIVQLTADTPDARQAARAGFDAWKAADPRHAAAAAAMERLLGQVETVRDAGPPGAGRAALSHTLARRDRAPRLRRAAGALALALALAVPGWFLWQAYPPAVMMADLRAGTGEWKTEVLPDGTRITLNSGSAVNLRYDARRRALELLRGEILVDVSKDASRPFLVETPDGSMRAVGTRFVVSKTPDGTLLSVLESTVAVRTAQQRAAGGPDAAQVHAGQALRIHPDRVEAVTEIDASRVASAWAQHRLFADDRPLAEVLDILGRHRSGLLQYDAAAIAQVRVSAVLPLDDTERALQLIAANLPGLRIRHFTPYLVRVDLLPAP